MKVKKPSDVRDLVISIIEDILEHKKTIPQAGTISHMLGVWLKAWELEKAYDLEKRVKALERERKNSRESN